MSDRIEASLDGDQPPAGLSAPLQALWWLKKGDLQMGPEWRTAHEICQTAEGDKAHDWVHALVHWIEGDESNATYWYRRVGERRHGTDVVAEWQHIVDRLGG